MTDERDDSGPASVPGVPKVKARRRISFVWIIPIVALAIGGWLAWKTISEKGPTITISLATASGLQAGTTKIRYRDVDIGTVTQVALNPDLTGVIATAEMVKSIAPQLNDGTQFWVVEPRLTAGGVSGLGTLFSGSYIGMLPGTGPPNRDFVALDEPPVLTLDTPGRRFSLKADRLGSVSAGSPIYFRGLPVGQVLGYHLDDDNKGVTFFIFVDEPHHKMVREGTRFWNASGIDVAFGAGGVNVQTESLQAILTGGIAFDTPLPAESQPPAAEGTTFALFASHRAVEEAGFTKRIPYLVEFLGSVRGLQVGSLVEFKGIQIGRVTDVRLIFDPKTGQARIPVTIELEPQRMEVVGGLGDLKPYQFMDGLVRNGLRAQLQSASLLTGELLVALDYFPDAAAATMTRSGQYPQIPTMPSETEVLTAKATQILDKLAALPLPQLLDEVRKTVRNVDRLIATDGTQSLEQLTPLLESLRNTSDAARTSLTALDGTLGSANSMIGDDSHLRFSLIRMLEELTQTARSLRGLGNTLDRQPQSVIFGQPDPSKP